MLGQSSASSPLDGNGVADVLAEVEDVEVVEVAEADVVVDMAVD